MAKRKAGTKKAKQATTATTAASSRSPRSCGRRRSSSAGSIEPADYKRYVLPIIFLRFLSLRYERRRAELEKLIADPKSDYSRRQEGAQRPRRVPQRRRVHRARRGPLGHHRQAGPGRRHQGAARQHPGAAGEEVPGQAAGLAAAHLRRLEPRRRERPRADQPVLARTCSSRTTAATT